MSTERVALIPAGQELEVVGEADHGWTQVCWEGGREGWVDGRGLTAVPPASSRSRRWIVVALVVVLLGAGAAAVVLLAQDDDEQAAVAPTTAEEPSDGDEPDESAPATEAPETDEPGVETTVTTASVPTTEARPASAIDIDEAVFEQAIAEAAATPPENIETPGRREVATRVLIAEFTAAGLDLTGLELTVYPLTPEESMLVMSSDDTTPLLDDDAGSELFINHLLASPTIDQFDISQLVIRFSSADE
jgi:uncharacterized protein YgiM (DUF1202 family)